MTHSTSEEFGNIPQASEPFGNVRNDAEPFRNVRKLSERTENHTLTVREVARLFENESVPRTERSIINWCRINRQGVARLDAFFDENEGRYYITPESVMRAIEEEKAKQPPVGTTSAPNAELPNDSETKARHESDDSDQVKELERQNRDLQITTRAKDLYLEQLQKERTQFVEQLVGIGRYVGELETQLLQLGGAPRSDHSLTGSGEFLRNMQKGTGNSGPESFPQGGIAA